MINKSPYQNYQQNAILSAGPEELTTMLYSRLVKDLKQASDCIATGDIEAAHKSIVHAQDIIIHLMNTLNKDLEIGKNYDLLYEYMNHRLIEADLKKDVSILAEIRGFAEELRDAWVQAVKIVKSNT